MSLSEGFAESSTVRHSDPHPRRAGRGHLHCHVHTMGCGSLKVLFEKEACVCKSITSIVAIVGGPHHEPIRVRSASTGGNVRNASQHWIACERSIYVISFGEAWPNFRLSCLTNLSGGSGGSPKLGQNADPVLDRHGIASEGPSCDCRR